MCRYYGWSTCSRYPYANTKRADGAITVVVAATDGAHPARFCLYPCTSTKTVGSLCYHKPTRRAQPAHLTLTHEREPCRPPLLYSTYHSRPRRGPNVFCLNSYPNAERAGGSRCSRARSPPSADLGDGGGYREGRAGAVRPPRLPHPRGRQVLLDWKGGRCAPRSIPQGSAVFYGLALLRKKKNVLTFCLVLKP